MPLIINELITTVEAPQGEQQAPVQAAGADEMQGRMVEQLKLNEEREERLSVD